jgi:carbamoyltransferase
VLIIGYTGSTRSALDRRKRRLSLLKKLDASRSYFDSLMSFGEDEEDVPINYFPLRGIGHDSAACLIEDGEVIACASEERFNRRKHSVSIDGSVMLPRQSMEYCLRQVGKRMDEVDYICYYLDMSQETFDKRIKTLAALLPDSVRDAVVRANLLSYQEEFCHDKVYEALVAFTGHEWNREQVKFVPHHLAHAASSFYSSGFEESGILTFDGHGETSSSIVAMGSRSGIDVVEEAAIPTSLGIVYMIFTAFLGFRPLNDEYKVMGLASYGTPNTYAREFASFIDTDSDGGYNTDILLTENLPDYIRETFGPPREMYSEITQREMDVAAALQAALESCVINKLEHLRKNHGFDNLCLAGGVALNCALNGRIARSGLFKRLYVFPGSGDDGCSLGAAQYLYRDLVPCGMKEQQLRTIYLGPEYGEREMEGVLTKHEGAIEWEKLSNVEHSAAKLIAEQEVVAWYQGRMEFGPRALGNRSILGDPRNPQMKDIINRKVKRREPFRPFAPAVKLKDAETHFDMMGLGESPYMLFVMPVKPESRELIPSVTHCDGTARIQTVKREDNERFWRLLDIFGDLTGIPVLLNTSFNVSGEPIVCSPEDAVKCFLNTNIDTLVMDDYVIRKPAPRRTEWTGNR